MNTPSSHPDPSGNNKSTSDYRANQLQDAAARTLRVERARLEKLWNMHLDGELSADSKGEFESLCKRHPDLSRQLRTTGMLLSGMNLLTADVPPAVVTDRDRNAAILAAVQAERPFVSSSEARAIRRQRWILAGSAAAILLSIVAADRFFPGWKDPAGMSVAARSSDAVNANRANPVAAASAVAAPVTTAAGAPALQARRDGLNAKAQLTLGKTGGTTSQPELNLSTDLVPTMASQDALASHSIKGAGSSAFGIQANETWLLQSIARGSASASTFGGMPPVGPFMASARLRLTDAVGFPVSSWHDASQPFSFDEHWNGLLHPEMDRSEFIPSKLQPKRSGSSN